MDIKLVCLIVGAKKKGDGDWYKATLLGHNSKGKPITADFFLTEDVEKNG